LGADVALGGTVTRFGALTELRVSVTDAKSGAVRDEYTAWSGDEEMKENIGRLVHSLEK
jgi:hypothetical protein